VEPETSNSDSNMEDSDFELNTPELEEAPNVFDTNFDLNMAEHSE